MQKNISVEEANKLLSNETLDLELSEVALQESLDYVLAEDIASDINMPPFDKSPLDGYAYKAEDTINATEASPVVLEVIDSIQAGYVCDKTVQKGQAVRLMTGAKIPVGADVVTMYEATEFNDREVKIFKYLKPMSNIIKAGEDMKTGDLILSKGITLGPAEIGVLASLGKTSVKVYRKPKIAIFATGDELLDIDQELQDGKIRNSNSYVIAAHVRRLGGEAVMLGICKDNVDETKKMLISALEWADMVITTGGASVGDADIIKEAFQEAGAEILFWKTKMKPGTPIVAAKHGNKLLFGLSGNPAAAYITFEIFVRPAILRQMGKTKNNLMKVNSILENDFNKVGGQNRYVSAFTYKKGDSYFTILPEKHSPGVLSGLTGMNSLFFVPGGSGPYKKGDRITVELLNHLEEEL